jgi:hypothetical protein
MASSWGKGDVCGTRTQQEDDERVDAEDLYRLAPEDFTAARDAAAKQARADGDREGATALKALRRPTASAWLLNTARAREPELVEQLLQLGPGLAQAQAGRDAAALRRSAEQRRQLVGAVVERAVAAGGPAGHRGGARRGRVDARSRAGPTPRRRTPCGLGRLVRALSYAGFGAVDLADAVAPPTRGPGHRGASDAEPDGRRQRLAEAEAAALEAAGRLDDAVRACRDAERAHETAEAEQERAGEVDG